MKKIFTTIALMAGMASVFAQWQTQQGGNRQYPNYPQQNGNYNQYSSLIINAASQRQLSVSVDNYQYQGNGGDINVGQLNAGNHNIVIYEWKRNFWGKNVQRAVYNSSLYLKPGMETTLYINPFGQVNVSERQLYSNGGYGNNGNGRGYGYGRMKDKHRRGHGDDDHDDRKGRGRDRDDD